MGITFSLHNIGNTACQSQNPCPDKYGCPDNRCPDFIIKRHDTKPPLKVAIEDCDGPVDLQGLVIEANMWANAKLKKAIDDQVDYFSLADNIGFEQIMVGDIIVMDRIRSPEYMLVTGFDEDNSYVRVQRGYRGTTPCSWKKGQRMRIFRILNGVSESEMAFEDIQNVDGTTTKDVLTQSALVYEWQPGDTCLPGCYWLEFKVMKMIGLTYFLPGGVWEGPIHRYEIDNFYYTGTVQDDSAVRLTYNQVSNRYLMENTVWKGANHEYLGLQYTGTLHTDGSVQLSRTSIPAGETIEDLIKNSFLPGGVWIGAIHLGEDGKYYSGSSHTSSSVVLGYNETLAQYELPHVEWFGAVHVYSGILYTGVSQDDGSVQLEPAKTYREDFPMTALVASNIPSFTEEDLTPQDFGCILGEGVEWVKRYPTSGQGFLIKVEDSPTMEM